MTRLDVPGDIIVKGWPPEMICDRMSSRIESTVSKLVMSLLQDADAVFTE